MSVNQIPNWYDVGDLPRFTAKFGPAGGRVDPTTVVAVVRTPSGVETPYTYGTDPEVVKDATGEYHIDVDLTEAGDWIVLWQSDGTGKAAGEQRVRVRRPMVTRPL